MTLKDDLKAHQNRWAEVNASVDEARGSASLELRWRQLNAAYPIAIGLELPRQDSGESQVFERWAKSKEKTANQPPSSP